MAFFVRVLPLLVVLSLPALGQAQFTYFTNSSTITIKSYTGSDGAVVIPDTINGLPVTSIGISAFYQCSALRAISLPDTVTSIGNHAFIRCTNLTSITIPDDVTIIGDSVFEACSSLTNVTLGSSITNIGQSAFCGCASLGAITVPSRLTHIGQYAFFGANGLTNIIIPDTVTSIGDWAFYACLKLPTITIPDSVTNVGHSVFYDCRSLTNVSIGSGVNGIREWMFCQCTNLVTVTIPENVIRIGDGTFYGCTSLTSAYFEGDAPLAVPTRPFQFAENVTVYYLPGRNGWEGTFAGAPTALWKPRIQACGFGLLGNLTNHFGFNIAWARGKDVVIEACADLANPLWLPVATNNLTSSVSYFADVEWTNYPSRCYRLKWQ